MREKKTLALNTDFLLYPSTRCVPCTSQPTFHQVQDLAYRTPPPPRTLHLNIRIATLRTEI
jgi:hypothetical protein